MKKILLLSLITLIPMSISAANMTSSETESMVTQMKTILDQYAFKIRALEVENSILREEVRKAGIQIPLSVFSGAIVQVATTTGSTTNQQPLPQTIVSSWALRSTWSLNLSSTGITTAMVESISKQYSVRYAQFIKRIANEWIAIQSAYKLPSTSYIWWYEFVNQNADNHVFVDVIYDVSTATNAYDAKILYEYNTGTYQRKLIGFFELDRTTWFYKTKSGNNPFAWAQRVFIRDPRPINTTPPVITISTWSTSTWTISIWSTSTWSTSNWTLSTTQANINIKIPAFSEIDKAYTDKRYLSVISLSNTYLTANPATYDLLRIRYRTYFIIWKYNEALSEIAKIENMGKMSSTVACDAQVIATYSKDAALISKYTTACKK